MNISCTCKYHICYLIFMIFSPKRKGNESNERKRCRDRETVRKIERKSERKKSSNKSTEKRVEQKEKNDVNSMQKSLLYLEFEYCDNHELSWTKTISSYNFFFVGLGVFFVCLSVCLFCYSQLLAFANNFVNQWTLWFICHCAVCDVRSVVFHRQTSTTL